MINAELYGHAQALAVLEERQRLARNLHDAVNQSLFSAGLIAEVLPRLWERDQEEARRSLEDLRRLTRGAQAEMRALLAELRPSTLTDSDLGDLLRLLGNALSGRTNIPRHGYRNEGDSSFPLKYRLPSTAYVRKRFLILPNMPKPARLRSISTRDESSIELRIRDDGWVLILNKSFSGHYGLGMMRERAEAVGAILSITSQPGHGTELTIRWTPSKAKEVL